MIMDKTGILLFFLLSIFPDGLISQELSPGPDPAAGEDYFEQGLSGALYIPGRKLIGDPWFPSEKWTRGDVRLTSGVWVMDKMLRYNGYLDELFWLSGADYSQVKVDRDLISEFILHSPPGNIRFTRITVHVPPLILNREVLGEILYEGNISLYCYRRVIETGLGDHLVGNRLVGGRKITPSHLYILELPCGSQTTISRIRRSSILSLFPENRNEIRRMLRQNRLGPSNARELAEVLKLLEANTHLIE
jgi:hypothetical protein